MDTTVCERQRCTPFLWLRSAGIGLQSLEPNELQRKLTEEIYAKVQKLARAKECKWIKSSGFAELDRRCHSGLRLLRQIIYTNLRKANLCCQIFRNTGSSFKAFQIIKSKSNHLRLYAGSLSGSLFYATRWCAVAGMSALRGYRLPVTIASVPGTPRVPGLPPGWAPVLWSLLLSLIL